MTKEKRITREEIKTRLMNEILRLNADGVTDTEIAFKVRVSVGTIFSWKAGHRVPRFPAAEKFEREFQDYKVKIL